MGDVGEGASLHFAVLTVGSAQEDGGRGVTVGDGGDGHAYEENIRKHNIAILHAYKGRWKTSYHTQNTEFFLSIG